MNKTKKALILAKDVLMAVSTPLARDREEVLKAIKAIRAAISQSEAFVDQMEDERFGFAAMDNLGPSALTGGKMSLYDAFRLGWQAAKRDALNQAQRREDAPG